MRSQKSTTVRSIEDRTPAVLPTGPIPRPPAPPGPRPLRTAFALGERLAPGIAARGAARLWFRLPPPPEAARRRRFTPEGGTPFTTDRGGLRVTGRSYGPEDAPTAHLVHGWGGYWQQLAAHVPALLDAGYRVVAHDAPGHGDSPAGRHGPRTSTVMELAEAFAAVVWQQGPADLVVAHSIGAAAAMWARRHGTTAGSYAFIAPAASVDPMVDWFAEVLHVGPRTRPRLIERVERRIGLEVADFDVPRAARGLADQGPVPRLLCVHDRTDSDTPAQGSVDIVRAWPGSELVLTDGLGHRRVIWDESVVARVARFASA